MDNRYIPFMDNMASPLTGDERFTRMVAIIIFLVLVIMLLSYKLWIANCGRRSSFTERLLVDDDSGASYFKPDIQQVGKYRTFVVPVGIVIYGNQYAGNASKAFFRSVEQRQRLSRVPVQELTLDAGPLSSIKGRKFIWTYSPVTQVLAMKGTGYRLQAHLDHSVRLVPDFTIIPDSCCTLNRSVTLFT